MRHFLFGLFALCLSALGASAQSSYSIRPGDTLKVEVLEDTSLNREVLVLPDGSISFPMAGSLPAAGRTVDSLRAALSSALAPNFATPPSVFVSVGELAVRRATGTGTAVARTVAIYAMGEVANPGKVDATPGITILQALAQAGGFTRFAATKRIELHRTDPRSGTEQVYLFNYKGRGGISGSTRLIPGDVLVVPERQLFE